MHLVRVAVPVPALGPLTYSVPEQFPEPSIGARVLVPLGNRVMTGVVIDVVARSSVLVARDPGVADRDHEPRAPNNEYRTTSNEPRAPSPEQRQGSIKSIIDLLDAESFLPPDIVRLASWAAEYYACGPGEAIAAATPPRAWIESERHAQITEAGQGRLLVERGVRRDLLDKLSSGKTIKFAALTNGGRGRQAALLGLERDGLVAITRPLKGSASAFRTERVAHLTAQGLDVAAADDALIGRLGQRQLDTLAVLRGTPSGLSTAALAAAGISGRSLARLAALGLIVFERRRIERDPYEPDKPIDCAAAQELVLTAEQASALEQLRTLATNPGFNPVLLHGVTGSGKTELYLRLADHVRRAGRGVLVLVPEIALTPAVAAAFRRAFGDRVAIQHSGLSDGERHDQWHRIRRGEVDIVVGTRSAVFAPVHSLGLIIVDEEHDGSYKQEESPRYHARDVAVVRARLHGALVVLGSATPSMESYHNALNGRYTLVTLAKRVFDRPLAEVRTVDMREEYASGGPDVILSSRLSDALSERLARHEQAIVLLNRRGFATTVVCRQCASTLECRNCSVSLTVYRAAKRARCHYCNYSMALPKSCTHCAGPYLELAGFGTERVEAEIRENFPHARVARVDRDSIRRRGAVSAVLKRFAAGDLDVLVGTQMIAKGHNFPRVTLVGVISADVGLGLADFRAAERTFQLLTQVAGRAGRGENPGEAIVQTLFPNHYSIRHACRQEYAAFYEDEIAFRRAMRYPPAIALINAIVKGRTDSAAMRDAGELVQALRSVGESYRVLGPASAPLSRLKGEHRAQFFLKGTHRRAMRQALLRVLEARPEIRRKTVVDVDPMSVL